MRYTVILIADEQSGGYVARVPAILGCVTQGESIEEALMMAQDAASAMIESMIDHDEEVPTEDAARTIVASIDVAIPAAASAVA